MQLTIPTTEIQRSPDVQSALEALSIQLGMEVGPDTLQSFLQGLTGMGDYYRAIIFVAFITGCALILAACAFVVSGEVNRVPEPAHSKLRHDHTTPQRAYQQPYYPPIPQECVRCRNW